MKHTTKSEKQKEQEGKCREYDRRVKDKLVVKTTYSVIWIHMKVI